MLPTCTCKPSFQSEVSVVFGHDQTAAMLFFLTVSLAVPQPTPPQAMLHPPLCLFLLCNTKQKSKI